MERRNVPTPQTSAFKFCTGTSLAVIHLVSLERRTQHYSKASATACSSPQTISSDGPLLYDSPDGWGYPSIRSDLAHDTTASLGYSLSCLEQSLRTMVHHRGSHRECRVAGFTAPPKILQPQSRESEHQSNTLGERVLLKAGESLSLSDEQKCV